MRRSVLLVLGLTAGAVSFTACRDVAVAPTAGSAGVLALDVPPVRYDELAASGSGFSYRVTLDPTRDIVYSDGINSIRIPAGTICDPATSSYGPGTWDAPCAPARQPIELTLTLSAMGGGMVVHFGHDLRFAPSSDPARQVILRSEVPNLLDSSIPTSAYAILWVPTGTQQLVDEGATDPSLATVVDRIDGRLTRRLKHFSGYYVNLGFQQQCDATVDTTCQSTGG